MIESHTFQAAGGLPLHYAEAAGDGPPLLILHGLSGSHDEFLHLVPALARQAHVYLLDLRGHGRSGWSKSGYRVPDYAGDVVAFLERVVARPAIVMGHSLGGLVTIWLAAKQPQLLRAIFIEDMPAYLPQMPRFGQSPFYPYFSRLHPFLRRHQATGGTLAEVAATVGQIPVGAHSTYLDVAGPDAVRERARQLHQLDPATLEPALAGTLFGEEEPDAMLAQIRCPVHLVAARAEWGGAMEARDVRRALAHLPQATHAIIDGAGHDIHLDQPERFLRELSQFVDSACVTDN